MRVTSNIVAKTLSHLKPGTHPTVGRNQRL